MVPSLCFFRPFYFRSAVVFQVVWSNTLKLTERSNTDTLANNCGSHLCNREFDPKSREMFFVDRLPVASVAGVAISTFLKHQSSTCDTSCVCCDTSHMCHQKRERNTCNLSLDDIDNKQRKWQTINDNNKRRPHKQHQCLTEYFTHQH